MEITLKELGLVSSPPGLSRDLEHAGVIAFKDTIKTRTGRKFQDAPHPEREVVGVLSRTLACSAIMVSLRSTPTAVPGEQWVQQAKKVPCTAANVKYVESGAERSGAKEFLGDVRARQEDERE